jgi:plasmid replication initiation protein
LKERFQMENILQVTFISSCWICEKHGVIQIGPLWFYPFFPRPKSKFTTFDLEVALSLKSVYAKRIYEILNMWSGARKSTKTPTTLSR